MTFLILTAVGLVTLLMLSCIAAKSVKEISNVFEA